MLSFVNQLIKCYFFAYLLEQKQFVIQLLYQAESSKNCWILCETIAKIQNLAKNILEYIKRLMRDFQQKKDKSEAFDKLSESAGFWLKDFCQKIIPLKFKEGQEEYFDKKG